MELDVNRESAIPAIADFERLRVPERAFGADDALRPSSGT
jgi:hypothetical protein